MSAPDVERGAVGDRSASQGHQRRRPSGRREGGGPMDCFAPRAVAGPAARVMAAPARAALVAVLKPWAGRRHARPCWAGPGRAVTRR